jgi:hypothetical protein
MDAFEHVIATILERDGFWVRSSYKVELTKSEKVAIGRPSSPRWELDVIGYRPGDNLLRVVECKSYLDSRGVTSKAFIRETQGENRYKLFTESKTREVVFNRLEQQLREKNAIRESPAIELCLAAGKVVQSELPQLEAHFEANGWLLMSPQWIQKELHAIADSGYDNAVVAVTAKLLLRSKITD